jgi:hypothetical protein
MTNLHLLEGSVSELKNDTIGEGLRQNPAAPNCGEERTKVCSCLQVTVLSLSPAGCPMSHGCSLVRSQRALEPIHAMPECLWGTKWQGEGWGVDLEVRILKRQSVQEAVSPRSTWCFHSPAD